MWYTGCRPSSLTKGKALTATPPEIREANEQEALLALLDAPTRALVEAGDAYVVAGRRPDRPWVRRTGTHAIVQGQSPNTPDPAATGKRTALKQTASYREALEAFVPLFPDADQQASFKRLVENVMAGVEGTPQMVTFPCPHPESCTLVGRGKGKDHVVAYAMKPDLNVGFKLIELLAGRAAQTVIQTNKNVNVNVELEHRTFDVRVYDMSTQTAEERKQALIESGTIEAEWLEKVLDD